MKQQSGAMLASYFAVSNPISSTGRPYFPATTPPFDLSLSENPLGPSKKAAMQQLPTDRLASYPSDAHRSLKAALARHAETGEDRIVLGAGIDDLLHSAATAFLRPRDEVVAPAYTFPKLAYYAALVRARVIHTRMTKDLRIDFAALHAALHKNPRLIYLCNPNNPTGAIEHDDEIVDLAKRARCLVIVDEANTEYRENSSALHLVDLDNLLVLRTFSKGYGLASARVGYAIGSPLMIAHFERARPRFPASASSMAQAEAALSDQAHIAATRAATGKETAFLGAELNKRGFRVYASRTNCFVAEVPNHLASARQLQTLVQPLGASFVAGDHFGMPPSFLRLAPRSHCTNQRFIETLDSVL